MISTHNPIPSKLKGYISKVNKNQHLIALSKDLSDAEYRLWQLLLSAEGFDKSNRHYGKLFATQADIAEILDWDTTKVSKILPNMVKKGLIKRYERGCIYISNNDCEQENIATTHIQHALEQQDNALTQTERGYYKDSSLVSYKSNLISSTPYKNKEGLETLVSKKERVYKAEDKNNPADGYEYLTNDDLDWIDMQANKYIRQ